MSTTPAPAPAPMTADKEMAAWLHRTCTAKKVNKTYGCDNFHCVYCRAARYIGIDADHIVALTARVAELEREALSALEERERLRERVELDGAEIDEIENLRNELGRAHDTLRYLKAQAENGTLHSQVVIQNVRAALKDTTP